MDRLKIDEEDLFLNNTFASIVQEPLARKPNILIQHSLLSNRNLTKNFKESYTDALSYRNLWQSFDAHDETFP